MKIITIIIRTVLGLYFLYTCYYFSPEPASTGFKAFQVGLMASTYLFPLAKVLNFMCAYHL
jgi:hypothetical protein